MHDGICPDPHRRIYIGRAWHETTKVKGVRDVWVCFGKLDEEGTNTVERYHSQPVGTQPMSEDTPSKMILDSIPERFDKQRRGYFDKNNSWLTEAAWDLAVSLWPTDTRIMVEETVHESKKRNLDDEEEATGEDGDNAKRHKGPEEGRGDERMQDDQHTGRSSGHATSLTGDYQDLPMNGDAAGEDLDDDSTKKAWFDFNKPCSDTVTSRMGEILQREHLLQSKPPKDLLDYLRTHGRLMAFVEKEDVFDSERWKAWTRDIRATPNKQHVNRETMTLGQALQCLSESTEELKQVVKRKREAAAREGGQR